MASLDFPKLRPLSVQRFEHEGQSFAALIDPLGVFQDPVLVPIEAYRWVVRHLDGRTSLEDLQATILRETGQQPTWNELEFLVDQLDRAMVLDGPTFARFLESYQNEPVRPPALAGRSYPGNARELRSELDRYFLHVEGAGAPGVVPSQTPSESLLRGVLSPHIDFQRGGPVYTWAYKAIAERSDADVFVILGVAHQYCRNRFALTRKDFDTPLGLVRTDRDFVDRIAARAGDHLFEDELAHRAEHSIEFQAVFLQYLLGGRRSFSIVPILVGSFHDLLEAQRAPMQAKEIREFVEALKSAEAESGKKVLYLGGIDLCHVGPEFGDPDLVDREMRERVRSFDQEMMGRAIADDPEGWFGTASKVGNRWRVCGLAATYTMLQAMGPVHGKVLRYDQAVDPARTCCVSFASLAFETNGCIQSPETLVESPKA